MNMNKIEGTAFISYDMSGSIDNEKQAYYKKVYDYYNNLYKNVKVIAYMGAVLLCSSLLINFW